MHIDDKDRIDVEKLDGSVYVSLRDDGAWGTVVLTPAQARQIAAELNRLADELEAENRDLKSESEKGNQ